MEKRLNPELFGAAADSMGKSTPAAAPSSSELFEFPDIESQLSEIRGKLRKLEGKMTRSAEALGEVEQKGQQRFERALRGSQRTEQAQTAEIAQLKQQIAGLIGRLSERKVMETKIFEMIDRHNSVLKNFEHRMSQMKKILMEKEALIAKITASLNESKQDIARMKRL